MTYQQALVFVAQHPNGFATLGGRSNFFATNNGNHLTIINSKYRSYPISEELYNEVLARKHQLQNNEQWLASNYTDPIWRAHTVPARVQAPYLPAIWLAHEAVV